MRHNRNRTRRALAGSRRVWQAEGDYDDLMNDPSTWTSLHRTRRGAMAACQADWDDMRGDEPELPAALEWDVNSEGVWWAGPISGAIYEVREREVHTP